MEAGAHLIRTYRSASDTSRTFNLSMQLPLWLGTIIKVQAHEGDAVAQRQVLVILSAMKMEHTIIAPYEGKVRRIYFHEGDVVKGGATIVEME